MTTPPRWRHRRFGWLALLVVAGIAAPRSGAASSHADRTGPCCAVLAVNALTQTVTAREIVTGQTFAFKVLAATSLRTFTAGATFDVDLRFLAVGSSFALPAGATSRFASGTPCCTLLSRPAAPASAELVMQPAAPIADSGGRPRRGARAAATFGGGAVMAAIVSVDTATGIATARDYGNGVDYRFALTGPEATQVRAGQHVTVDARGEAVTVLGLRGSFRLVPSGAGGGAPTARSGGPGGGRQPYTGVPGGDQAPRLECEAQSGEWICTTVSMGDNPEDPGDDTIRCVCAIH